MNFPEPHIDQLLVATEESIAFVRVLGRGSFKVSRVLKSFCNQMMDKGTTELVFDMIDCVGMDSTFMGVLAGLSSRFKKAGVAGEVVMINLNTRTSGSLETLGLSHLVTSHMAGSTPAKYEESLQKLTNLDMQESTTRETAEMMLEAHENLVDATPENLARFKDVLRYLREDLENVSDD